MSKQGILIINQKIFNGFNGKFNNFIDLIMKIYPFNEVQ